MGEAAFQAGELRSRMASTGPETTPPPQGMEGIFEPAVNFSPSVCFDLRRPSSSSSVKNVSLPRVCHTKKSSEGSVETLTEGLSGISFWLLTQRRNQQDANRVLRSESLEPRWLTFGSLKKNKKKKKMRGRNCCNSYTRHLNLDANSLR